MAKYTVSEKQFRYKILFYSENPVLINSLRDVFSQENIEIIIRSINTKEQRNFFKKNEGNWLKVVYDLSSYNANIENILIQMDRISRNSIFIVKSSGSILYKTLTELKNNTVIDIDGLSKYVYLKAANIILNHTLISAPGYIKVVGRKTIRKKRLKKTAILVFFPLLLLFLIPYLISLYLLINLYFIRTDFFKRVDVRYLNRWCSVNVFVKNGLEKINKLYYKIPLVHVLYNFPIRISNETTITSDNICQIITESYGINILAKSLLVPGVENNISST